MNTNVKFAAVALAAALVGGSAGATLTSWKSQPAPAEAATTPAVKSAQQPVAPADEALTDQELAEIELEPQPLAAPVAASPARRAAAAPAAAPTRQVASRSSSSAGTSRPRQVSPRRVYYDYSEPNTAASAPASYNYEAPKKKNFFQRHRDLITVGAGAGTGAAIGGATGGKKGALIGTGIGAGGAALYTYVLRNRDRD
jgi:hypothetical protein